MSANLSRVFRQQQVLGERQHRRPLLMREHMLDGAAHFRLLRIDEARSPWHRLALGLFAMNARDEAAPRQHLFVLGRAISRIRIDVARRVGPIVDRDTVLISNGGNGEIEREPSSRALAWVY